MLQKHGGWHKLSGDETAMSEMAVVETKIAHVITLTHYGGSRSAGDQPPCTHWARRTLKRIYTVNRWDEREREPARQTETETETERQTDRQRLIEPDRDRERGQRDTERRERETHSDWSLLHRDRLKHEYLSDNLLFIQTLKQWYEQGENND